MILDRALAFDLETTGVEVLEDRIVTASVIRVRPEGQDYTEVNWLVNPGVEIPQGAIDVHGISNERAVAEGVDPKVALQGIIDEFAAAKAHGVPLVGYNLAYDLSLLSSELLRHGFDTPGQGTVLPEIPVLDAMVIDKFVDPYRKGGRKLTQVAEFYGVPLENAHASNADALASALVLRKILEVHSDKLPADVWDLYYAQVGWRRAQQESLEAYLRRSKNDDSIVLEKSWPNTVGERRYNLGLAAS